ncbi:UDP-glucose 4-epimerase [Skermanella stibiiresistens SB22]|uniref:UDP-glucose 4-epimerase n=1 Tax=Skermanella stibiiresistens SB22 TaxID=1385369 RepID=W9H4F2_9PROT|nr:UDP-glucose 4-epimerase GalE [Skermanella stibiiresistens]EWY39656.1 UDP-glucose 4-epimerase [Skermanella stibiiresistens SB22]
MPHHQTVLVTGGAGFVGSHCVAELVERGHSVVVFDNLQQGHRAAVPDEAEFVEGDLASPAALTRLFGAFKFDAILHFASNSLVGESMRDPHLYLHDNVVNALNLVQFATDNKVPRFVLSSTANLFGMPDRMPIDEDTEIDPGSPYGESKFMIERILHWADKVHGMRSACLRYFNAAGAHPDGHLGEDHDPETHLIPLVLDVAAGKRPHIEIFGDDYPTVDGTCVRDYIHVSDLADAHVRVLSALDHRSCRYNLGNGRGYTVRQVIETARAVTGRDIQVRIGARRPGDPPVLIASSERVRADLGWNPRFPDLETIIHHAWDWRRRNPDGYQTHPVRQLMAAV